MAGKLRVEGWTLPTTGTFKRKFFHVPVVGGTGRRELSAWHSASLDIPRSWSRLPDLLSGTLLRVYDGSIVVDEIVAERMPQELRTDSTVTVTGPQIAGLLSKVGVYPPDWPANPSQRPNWVWAGDNALGDLSLGRLGNIHETWEVYLSGERYVLDKSGTSAGTFKLVIGSDETDDIDWNAGAKDIKSALEDIDGIDDVTVIHDQEKREFQIIFDDPKNLTTDMTLDDSNLTGTATLTKLNDGFDPSGNPTFTITVTVDGVADTTEALAWNASTNTIEGSNVGAGSGLQGLSNVDDVTVSGSGVAADPWEISFVVPPVIDSLVVNFPAGQAISRRTVAGGLDPSPITISKPLDAGAGPQEQYGTYDNPPIQVITDPAHLDTGADWVLRVNAKGQFAGSQLVASVQPGETYQAKIRVKPTADSSIRLIIRDEVGNLIARSDLPTGPLAADTWHDLTITDVQIPPNVDQIILRVAVTAGDPAQDVPFYVNWQGAELLLGLPPTTPGDIVTTLLEQAQGEGDGIWLDPSFDADTDSSGTPWPETYSYQADGLAMYLSDVLNDMSRNFGCEWTVTPKATPDGQKTHDLNLWPADGAGVDRTSTGPTLSSGGSVVGGEIVDRTPAFTRLVGWGADDRHVTDENSTTKSTYGQLTRFLDVEELADDDSIQKAIDTAFADEQSNLKAGNVTLRGSGSVVPFVHFGVGDKLVWQSPPAMDRNERRVQTISWSLGSGAVAEYEVQGSRVWGEASPLEAIIRLLDAPKKRRRAKVAGGAGRDLGQVTGAHIHLVRTSSLSLTAATPAVVPWTAANVTHPPRNVGWSGSVVTIQEPGYYNVDVMLALASASEGAAVHITRTRGGSTTIVWPPSADPDIWSVSYSTKAFSGTAHAIECLSGDQLQVFVTAAETVDLTGATLAAYLVDRITQRDTWELVFSAFNFGVAWDGSSWWTTDHRDNVNPALFKRSPSGSILNSYQGFDSPPNGPHRSRSLVYVGGFIYGVGNDHRQVAKIDPSDGSSTAAFAPVSTDNNSGHFGIGYNGSNLFVVESDIYKRVEEYTVAGSHQGNHSFPAGRTLVDITWDGANWWATTSNGEIIRMDASFNETLSIPGPNAAAYGTSSPNGTIGGCQFLDGHLYVMTSQGLYRKAV